MTGKRRVTKCALVLSLAGAAALSSMTGCQTHVGGMTLPSPDYLRDKPDYIAPAPQYGHSRELGAMQRAYAEANPVQGVRTNRPVENRGNTPAPLAPAPAAAAPAPAEAK